MQAISGCAFCRANRKPWTGHTVEVCVELANCVCGYCKEKGHTPKKCPKSALKKQRDEEWAKSQEERKGKSETIETQKKTWSSLVVNSLTTEEREAVEQQHRVDKEREAEEKKKQYEERKKRREEAAIRAEQYYVRKMRREYGIEACDFAQAGDFWYFFIEGRKDDSNMAKVLREDPKNQSRFQKYLQEKYWVNWLSRTEFSEDDCRILDRWRWEEEKREYEQEKREEEEVKAYLKEQEDLVKSMEAKVERGEMTQEEFNEWKWDKEIEDDYAYQAEGDMMWHAHEQHEAAYKAWKQRSEGRK
jgi:hypothetical protein